MDVIIRYLRAEFVRRVDQELKKAKDLEKKRNVKPILVNQELARITPEQRRELRSLKSATNYIKRKRKQHEDQLDQARALKGTHIMVYDELTENWQYYDILDVRIKWLDQVDPEIRYVLQKYNEWKEADGEATEWDLSKVRWQETEEMQRDEDKYLEFCEAKELQRQLLEEQGLNEEARRLEILKIRSKDELEEIRRVKERHRKIAAAKERIEADADAKINDSIFRKKLWVNVLGVMEEMKHGILKDSKGHPFKKANKKIAEEEAYRRWKEAYTEDMIQVFEQRLDKEEQERKKAEKRKAVKMERKRLRHEARQKRLAERLKKK